MPRKPADGRRLDAERDYLLMGSTRSLASLCARYRAMKGRIQPPTRRLTTLEVWSRDFGWYEKARAHDAEQRRLQLAVDKETALEDARESRTTRLEVAKAARKKALEALELMDPSVLARRPGDLARLLALAGNEERKDAPPEETQRGRAEKMSKMEDDLLDEMSKRTIIVLPANNRDKPPVRA